MPHRITPDQHYTAGEYVRWEYTIEENGSAKDITNASVSWHLLNRQGDANADAVLDDGDTDVSASITNATNGRVDVELSSGATSDLSGNYWQRLTVTDSNGKEQIWSGTFPVNDP